MCLEKIKEIESQIKELKDFKCEECTLFGEVIIEVQTNVTVNIPRFIRLREKETWNYKQTENGVYIYGHEGRTRTLEEFSMDTEKMGIAMSKEGKVQRAPERIIIPEILYGHTHSIGEEHYYRRMLT